MERTVKERLIHFIKYKNLSQKRFEQAVGLSNGYVNNMSKSLGASKLAEISRCYPELNTEWLLTGEGEMLNTDVTPVGPADDGEVMENSHGVRFIDKGDSMLINVPLVPYTALGSPLDEYAQLLQNEGSERISFPVDGVHHGSYFAFRVEGDSMDDGTFNGFRPGDIVLVRELDRQDWAPKLHISKWPFWVICWDNCVRLKQIVGQTGDSITCHSLNPSPEYCDFTLPLEGVKRLFNVVQVQPKPRIF